MRTIVAAVLLRFYVGAFPWVWSKEALSILYRLTNKRFSK